MKNKIEIRDLGRLPYEKAWDYQKKIVKERLAGHCPDTLLLVEHPPVITLGRRGGMDAVQADIKFLEKKGIAVVKIERGGLATYHGPGQLVGYPIVYLKERPYGVKDFVFNIEALFISLLRQEFETVAKRDPINHGVWIGDNKVLAIGIALDHWVTYHGFAFNVSPDLSHFKWIVPCGITHPNKGVTSLAHETGASYDLEKIKRLVVDYFYKVFGYEGFVKQKEHAKAPLA